jgi:hypothetical protein
MLKTQPVLIFEYTTQALVFNRGLLLNKGACRTYSSQAQHPSNKLPLSLAACPVRSRSNQLAVGTTRLKLYDDERTIRRKERSAEDRSEKN